MKKLVVFIFGLFVSFMANATTDTARTISSIGAQGNNAYVVLSPPPSGACLYGLVYIIDLGSTSGKGLYATLLTAYTQGTPLARVDYAKTSAITDQCIISLIQL